MISQFVVLTRVKRLREDKALEALQRARREVAEAEERLAALTAEVEESARTLPARTKAVFDEIMGEVTDMTGLDATKEKALGLERAHLKLIDRKERAAHVLQKRKDAAAEAATAYRAAQREHEKYADLLADMKTEAANEAIAKEEVEVEDLFTRPRQRIGA